MELTVTIDPVTGTWHFRLRGHAVEVAPRHGYVKIDGTLHTVPAVYGLENIEELNGAPLNAVERLLHPSASATPSAPTTPARADAPPQSTRQKKPAKRKRRSDLTTKPPAQSQSDKPQQTTPPDPPEHLSDVFDTKGAGRHLGLSPATLTTMRTRGGGPPFVKLGRRVVYRRSDLDTWLAKRVRKSTSDPGNPRK